MSSDPSAFAEEVAPAQRLPAVLHGGRLTLRRWMVSDADLMSRVVRESLDHLRPWMPWAAHEPVAIDDRRAFLEGWDREWRAGGDVRYLVFLGSEVVASTGLHRRLGPDALEIGYWVHVDHIGCGYATELSRVLTDAAFCIAGIDRVEIHHDRANVRSGAVPRKLGFVLLREEASEAVAPSETGITCIWAVTKEQWLSGTR